VRSRPVLGALSARELGLDALGALRGACTAGPDLRGST
jgi:hypothetical protein